MHILTFSALLVVHVFTTAQRMDATPPAASWIDTVPWSTQFWPPPPYPGMKLPLLSGRAELSFVNTSGNASTQTIGTAGQFAVRPGPWLIAAEGTFVRTTAAKTVQAESLTTQVRVSRALSPRVDGYAQGQYLRNTFAGLAHQSGLELGFSTALVDDGRRRLLGELAFGYINEQRLEGEDHVLSSGTVGVRYGWAISKYSEFSDEAFFTTNVSDPTDWRLRHTASISASLNAIFSLKVSHVLTYLREPVPGFERTDAMGSAAIVAKF
jgi:putative salt-induced outer membrane protein YdiY